MEFKITDILKETILVIWEMRDLFLPFVGIMSLMLVFRITTDLMSRKSKIKWFLGKKEIQDLQKLTPKQFEEYTAELFNALGYTTLVRGGSGDGGIDVEAKKDGVIHYIQCKKYSSSKVSVGAMRDFYGAIVDKINGGTGYFITTSVFTLAAEKFAEDKPIELIDRFKLMKYMKLANIEVPKAEHLICPKCGTKLVKRKGRYGSFMGCSTYPKCDYTEKYHNEK